MSKTKRRALRALTDCDLDMVLSWRNHPDVRRYMFSQNEICLVDHKKWFEQARGDRNKSLLIFEKNGVPCGFVNISKISEKVADWGFYLSPEAEKGTGYEMGLAALGYAFDELSLHKVCGQVIEYNERSIKYHLRLGFLQEGVLRDQYFNGEKCYSVVCFGLLANEWSLNCGGLNV